MIKRILTNIIIVAFIAASFFFTGTAQQPAIVSAEATTLSGYAGMAAYTQILDPEFDLETVKPAFQMIEYQSTSSIVGTLDIPIYESIYDPLVLVTSDGWIIAFYPQEDPAGKIVDVISKNLDETLLEKAVKIVAGAAGVIPTDIYHFNFGKPDATMLLLVAEYEPDGNEFSLNLDATNEYYEKSYAFYRTYLPSFTIDNIDIDQVNFVVAGKDYLGEGYYGTIYGLFPAFYLDEEEIEQEIDIVPGIVNTFAVQAGDHLGFGSLSILYSGDPLLISIADKDFQKDISLEDPGIDPTFDLTPSTFIKVEPGNIATGIGLAPTLSWTPSTAPNYEYCIDDINNNECDTEWINVGSDTSVTLSNLFYETTYYWQVRAINSYAVNEADIVDGIGTWWSFTTAEGFAPEVFNKFVLAEEDYSEPIGSLSKVTMSWEESYGAYYYEVCVDTTPDCEAPELWHNVGLATSATMSDLLLDTIYFWQVRAVNYYPSTYDVLNYIYADENQWQEFTTRTFSKLRPFPDEAKTYNITLPLEWEETPFATVGYKYCYDTSAPDTDPTTDDCNSEWIDATKTSAVLKGLVAGGTYYWQVQAIGDGIIEANDGEWWKFKVLLRKDSKKINIFKSTPLDDAVDQTITTLELSWTTTAKKPLIFEYCFFGIDDTDTTPISDDDICTYYDPDESTYPNPWIPDGDDTSATINDLDNSTTYLWQVRANIGTTIDPVWLYGDNGDYWAFTTLPAPLPE